jgi:hypothetical protein
MCVGRGQVRGELGQMRNDCGKVRGECGQVRSGRKAREEMIVP